MNILLKHIFILRSHIFSCTVAAIRDDSPRRARRKSIEQRSVNCVIMSGQLIAKVRPSTETIAILSRHVVHCTIIKYDDAALLFRHLSMAMIGESRSLISPLFLLPVRSSATKRSTRLPTRLRGGSPGVIRDDLCFDSTINNDM